MHTHATELEASFAQLSGMSVELVPGRLLHHTFLEAFELANRTL